jgi:hypothetical protein
MDLLGGTYLLWCFNAYSAKEAIDIANGRSSRWPPIPCGNRVGKAAVKYVGSFQ